MPKASIAVRVAAATMALSATLAGAADLNVLDRSARLTVQLRDSRTGVAVRGQVASSGTKEPATVESTAATGVVSLEATPGRYRLEASSPTHYPLGTAFELDADVPLNTTIWLDPIEVPEELRPEVISSQSRPGMLLLHGHVVDSETALPLQEVEVSMAGAVSKARTDADGYFRLLTDAKPDHGSGDLIVTRDGYASYVLRNVLLHEGDLHLIVELTRGSGSTTRDATHRLLQAAAPVSDIPRTFTVDPPATNGQQQVSPEAVTLPGSIRVGFNCSSASNCSSVNVYSLETYVANGLDDEWISSWTAESLKAGAVAYRSYGVWHVAHPQTANYDICSTASCQVNDPSDSATTVQAAVTATAGAIVVSSSGNSTFFAQYSAHNNNLCATSTCSQGGYTWTSCGDGYSGRPPTWPCLYDPVDAGQPLNGHGGGMSQWGSHRWGQQGQGWQWIVNHYYNDNGNPSGSRNGVLQLGSSAATATINSASASPQSTPSTSTFSISYSVSASAAMNVMLGASLRLDGTSSWNISDPAHDISVSLSSGNNSRSRQFSVSAAAGVYDMLVALWRDQNGNGLIDAGDQQLSSLTVQNAVTLTSGSSCKSLTLLRSPSNGGTIDANPTASIPCNFGYYLSSTQISLTAEEGSGYQFSGWSGTGGSFSTVSQSSTTFTITNDAQVTATFSALPPACSYSITPTSDVGSGSGGNGSIQVSGSPSGCTGSWSASPSSSGGWLTLTGTTNSSGSGVWQVSYSYSANPSTVSSRSGTVSFNGAFPSGSTFTLTQNPAIASSCSYSINPTSAPGAGGGGSGAVQVTGSPAGCTGSWSASPSSSGGWLTLTGTTNSSGSGSWQVQYSYPVNPSTSSSRTGTISFNGSFPSGSTFTLTQNPSSAGACSYSIDPTSAPGAGGGGSGAVQVTGSPSGCTGNWSASPSSSGGWLTLTGTVSGSGAGPFQVPYSYSANPSTSSSRTGTISFTGSMSATFTLTQQPSSGSGGGSELIVNGGFEAATQTGNTAPGWDVFPSPNSNRSLIVRNTGWPRTGATHAFLGSADFVEYDWLLQNVTIPANATSANLTLWVNIQTQEIIGNGAFDFLWIALYDTSGNLVGTLAALSNEDAVLSDNTLGNYVQIGPIDLSLYIGSSLDLGIIAFTDSIYPTTFLVDDVSLQVTSVVDNAPTASITSPANGATVGGTVNVVAAATDDHGVTSLQIDIDGVTKASNSNATSLTYSWNTTQFSNGQHTIVAKAADSAGHVTTSTQVVVTVSNVTLIAPPNFTATAASASQVNLSWGAVPGAASYQIFRGSTPASYALIGTAAVTSFNNAGLQPDTTYLYQVRAVDSSSNVGPPSATDLATTILFAGDPAVSGVTLIQAVHLVQLRTAVNAVRVAAGLGPAAFSGSIAPGAQISAAHVADLRSSLNAARTQLGMSALTYTNPTLVGGSTPVRAVHLNELRNGVK